MYILIYIRHPAHRSRYAPRSDLVSLRYAYPLQLHHRSGVLLLYSATITYLGSRLQLTRRSSRVIRYHSRPEYMDLLDSHVRLSLATYSVAGSSFPIFASHYATFVTSDLGLGICNCAPIQTAPCFIGLSERPLAPTSLQGWHDQPCGLLQEAERFTLTGRSGRLLVEHRQSWAQPV
jgi:hypothetical protein